MGHQISRAFTSVASRQWNWQPSKLNYESDPKHVAPAAESLSSVGGLCGILLNLGHRRAAATSVL